MISGGVEDEKPEVKPVGLMRLACDEGRLRMATAAWLEQDFSPSHSIVQPLSCEATTKAAQQQRCLAGACTDEWL